MNALSTITNGFASVVAAIRNRVQDARLAVSLIPSYLANLLWLIDHKFLTLAQQGYGKNAVVYAVLRVLSSAVAEPPLHLYSVDRKGAHKRIDEHTHPLLVLIDRPNELITQYEFWELTTLHCGIAGHSFWWKERDHVGNILALWPLRPDRVGPIYSTSAEEGEHALLGWSYQVPGTTQYIPVPRRDVIAFNLPNPAGESGGMIEGIGPLQVLATEVGADNEASKFVGNLLANYATPSLVIKTKVPLVSEDDAKRLKAGWKQQFGGMQRGEPAILDADSEVQQIAWSLDKLEFPDLRGIAESRIAAAFGVPAILVGLRTGLQEGIRATISEQREYFAETTLANYWRRFSDQMSEDLAKEYGEDLILRFDTTQVKALQLQTRQQKQPIADAWDAGVALLDEYREHVLQLPPLGPPYGSLLKWQTTDVPNQTNVEEDGTGQLVPTGTKSNGHALRARVVSSRVRPDLVFDFEESNGHTTTKAVPKVSRHQRMATAASKATVSTTLLAKQYEPRLRHVLKATHDAMVGGFAGSTKSLSPNHKIAKNAIKASADDAFSGDAEQYITELEQLIAELHVQGVQDGYDSLSGEPVPPGAFTLQNQYVSAAVSGLAGKIKNVSETTRQNVRDIIQSGIDDGLSIPDIAALLSASEAFSDYRATMIARTESRVAYNQGAVAAMKTLGTNYVYIDDGDKDDPCAEVSGTIQTIDWFAENPVSHPQCTRAGAPVPADEEPAPEE